MEKQEKIYAHIDNICIIGYGSIGKGAFPLIQRHFTFNKLTVIDPIDVEESRDNIEFIKLGLTEENYKGVFDKIFVGKTGFCVNLSVACSSVDIIIYCQEREIPYIDTANFLWGNFEPQQLSTMNLAQSGKYAFRQHTFKVTKEKGFKTTAIMSCGANPGMVSWFVKQAVINLAKDTNYPLPEEPKNQREWALLMMNLGVKGIHISQRDTQRSNEIKPAKEFWNTWSVDAYIMEAFFLPSEFGWGTHQKQIPKNGTLYKEGFAMYMSEPGVNVHVKSWCPSFGPQMGYVVSHDQCFTIVDYFTVKQNGKDVYRPTCNYAYHPSQACIASSFEVMGSGKAPQKQQWKILNKDIVTGMDELGVFLYGHAKNAYWYGSQLTIEDTRKRAPNQNATALQVTSAVLAGMVWALQNPHAGLVEADQMDYKRCLEIQNEYISPVNGFYTDWTPLKNRFNEFTNATTDLEDPWQFKNFLIHK